jgi:hypothetical protein
MVKLDYVARISNHKDAVLAKKTAAVSNQKALIESLESRYDDMISFLHRILDCTTTLSSPEAQEWLSFCLAYSASRVAGATRLVPMASTAIESRRSPALQHDSASKSPTPASNQLDSAQPALPRSLPEKQPDAKQAEARHYPEPRGLLGATQLARIASETSEESTPFSESSSRKEEEMVSPSSRRVVRRTSQGLLIKSESKAKTIRQKSVESGLNTTAM